MNLLGKCYQELAHARPRREPTGRSGTGDSGDGRDEKEIVYNLGLVYEKMGDPAHSIVAMKQIYEVDYGYRDVAQPWRARTGNADCGMSVVCV